MRVLGLGLDRGEELRLRGIGAEADNWPSAPPNPSPESLHPTDILLKITRIPKP